MPRAQSESSARLQGTRLKITPDTRLRADSIDKDKSRTWVQQGADTSNIVTETRRLVAVELSRQLASASPLYSRLVGATLDMVVPPGMQLQLQEGIDPDLEKTIMWMWKDGPSPLLTNATNMIKTLIIDGELVMKARVNTADGRVSLTLGSSSAIDELRIGNEGFKQVTGIRFSQDDTVYNVVTTGLDGKLSGDLFYFRTFPAGFTTGFRGAPLFAPQLDEIAAMTEFRYRRIARLSYVASTYWDVQINGATQDNIDEFLQSQHAMPPESGEIKAHNEQVVWDYKTPPQYGTGFTDEVKNHTDFLIGACGLSPEFMGYTQGRDITTESLFASISHLDALREEMFAILTSIVQFQIDMAVKHNVALDIPIDFKIIAKQIGTRSLQRAAQAFIRYADGLAKAVGEGLLSREEASGVLKLLLVQLGLMGEMELPREFGGLGRETGEGEHGNSPSSQEPRSSDEQDTSASTGKYRSVGRSMRLSRAAVIP